MYFSAYVLLKKILFTMKLSEDSEASRDFLFMHYYSAMSLQDKDTVWISRENQKYKIELNKTLPWDTF